ncbi:PDZ domain-containing protein [Janthinobacterium sp. GW460P]|uniref:S41 family peptidase n=1 Tax=unclassified Janthinobacterium TaxID=2610881 RepID=UPI000A32AC4A|nr:MULTISPECIES: S41 family peptidase [unclassified Janthinobacterium]MCC7705000.1 PDZ domain-containing protein [Janthinobacterium sp. GW460P]MCC7710385.1 PDZ domain-containing protein [Janthinobacterium sp. GW460W]
MHSLRLGSLAVSLVCVLSACGGGGGGSDSAPVVPPVTPTALVASSTVANRCEAPRSGSGIDKQGSLLDEQKWVRSWIDETYLWYREVPTTYLPQSFATAKAYFDVLKTTATTASGKPKDQFHFTYTTAEWEASLNGVELGYGMLLALTRSTPPRKAVISIVEPGSPADLAGLRRGDELQTVDGTDFVNASDAASVKTINAGLFPQAQGMHTLAFSRNGSPLSANLQAVDVSTSAVQNERIIDTPTGKVGYLTFNTHNNVAERQLVETMGRFQAAGISDLVLDVRYNGGGYLDVASELAYMIAGPQVTTGKTFEQVLVNDKTRPEAPVPFHTQSQGFAGPNPLPKGTPLPSLGLKRVTLLTTGNTCSASEAIINGLRGVDVQVNLIGGTTCGKPYGFYPAPNCGTTYFAVQFQGVNAKGFGDFADGMAPTCDVTDDYQHALGDPAEGMLAAALRYRSSGSCAPAAGALRLLSSMESPADTAARLLRPAYKEIALIRQ